jgi:hypothetical protein
LVNFKERFLGFKVVLKYQCCYLIVGKQKNICLKNAMASVVGLMQGINQKQFTKNFIKEIHF